VNWLDSEVDYWASDPEAPKREREPEAEYPLCNRCGMAKKIWHSFWQVWLCGHCD
jgi:hypothetical protein